MPFTFPDPNTTPEFTGKNGITYAWDADDSKWHVKSFAIDCQKEEMIGAYRILDAIVKLQKGQMIFGNPWGTIDPTEINYLRINQTDGSGNKLPDGLLASRKKFSLYRDSGGIAILAATFEPNGFYETPDQPFCEVPLDTAKTVLHEPLRYDADYYFTTVVPVFDLKEYIDNADDELRQDIIELEEEINAIAPSVEYGTWEWQNPSKAGRPPAAGTFHLLDDSIQPTDQYKNTKFIRIHNDEYVAAGDSDPVDTHTWADADPGKLIQLYDAADPDFLLGEIVSTVTDEPSQSVTIEVQLIQTSGVPNDNAVNGKYLTRINVFAPPSGGTADGFVLKTGDEMTGKLTLSNATAIDLKGKIQVNGTTTNSRFLGTDSYGNTSWKTALTSHVQADWNTTSTSSASYIKNKPTIPTVNYTISKDSYGNYYVS